MRTPMVVRIVSAVLAGWGVASCFLSEGCSGASTISSDAPVDAGPSAPNPMVDAGPPPPSLLVDAGPPPPNPIVDGPVRFTVISPTLIRAEYAVDGAFTDATT